MSAPGGVSIDPERWFASVGPAVSGGEFSCYLERHEPAFPMPHRGAVTPAGYLLGGGCGWTDERWGGFACLNIVAVEFVTPDGELPTASPTGAPGPRQR